MTDFEKKAFYTPSEIAELLQVHNSTVRDWIHSGKMFAYQLSERIYRVPLSSLMTLLGEEQPVTYRELSQAEADDIWRRATAEHSARLAPRLDASSDDIAGAP